MAYEAIQRVIDAEQSGRDRRAEAAAEAKRILADAEKTGRQAEIQARAAAEAQVGELLAQAEAQAAERSDALGQECAAACAALKDAARRRLEQAAAMIVEKVGDS